MVSQPVLVDVVASKPDRDLDSIDIVASKPDHDLGSIDVVTDSEDRVPPIWADTEDLPDEVDSDFTHARRMQQPTQLIANCPAYIAPKIIKATAPSHNASLSSSSSVFPASTIIKLLITATAAAVVVTPPADFGSGALPGSGASLRVEFSPVFMPKSWTKFLNC